MSVIRNLTLKSKLYDVGDGPVRATVVWTSLTEAGLSFDQGLADVPAKRTMPSADRPSAAA
jgi:hypothetical protein